MMLIYFWWLHLSFLIKPTASHVAFMDHLYRSCNLSHGDLIVFLITWIYFTRPLASVRDLNYLVLKDKPWSLSFFPPSCKAPPLFCNLALTHTVCVGTPSRRTHLSCPGVQSFLALATVVFFSSLSAAFLNLHSELPTVDKNQTISNSSIPLRSAPCCQ